MRKEDGGRLTPVDVNQLHQAQEDAQVERLVEILRAEAEARRVYSKSSFAQAFGGKNKPFGVGQGALKGVIDRAIRDSRIEVETGKAKVLRVRERVPKAKINPVSQMNDDSPK